MDKSTSRPGRRPDLLSVILRDAGVTERSVVRVAGKSGLLPLLWLCRMGFDDVAYLRAGDAATSAPADALLVLDGTTAGELERILGQQGQLREGGVLVLQAPDLRTPDGRDPIHAVLERAGYAVERCILRGAREVHVARKVGAMRRAA